MKPRALWCCTLFISFNCLGSAYPCHLGNNGAGSCHEHDAMPHIWRAAVCFLFYSVHKFSKMFLTSNSDLLDRRPSNQSHTWIRIAGRDFQARAPSPERPTPSSPTLRNSAWYKIGCSSVILLAPSSFSSPSSYSLTVRPVNSKLYVN